MKPHERLKSARLAAGYKTALQFTDTYGFSNSTYSLHESGKRGLKANAVEGYAQALGNCTPGWLMFGEGVGPDGPAVDARITLRDAPDVLAMIRDASENVIAVYQENGWTPQPDIMAAAIVEVYQREADRIVEHRERLESLIDDARNVVRFARRVQNP